MSILETREYIFGCDNCGALKVEKRTERWTPSSDGIPRLPVGWCLRLRPGADQPYPDWWSGPLYRQIVCEDCERKPVPDKGEGG